MADKLDMPLDDLVKSSKPARGGAGRGGARGGAHGGARGGARGGFAPERSARNPLMRSKRDNAEPYQRKASRADDDEWAHDQFVHQNVRGAARALVGRVGGNDQQRSLRAKVFLSNLDGGVNEDDLTELFGEVGNLVSVRVHRSNGISKGTADVVFERKQDAMRAIQKYHGVSLDNRPMSLQLIATALSGASAAAASAAPSFRVRLSGAPAAQPRAHQPQQQQQQAERAPRQPRAPRAAAASNGAAAEAPKKEPRKKTAPKSAEELDAELDSYHAQAEPAAAE